MAKDTAINPYSSLSTYVPGSSWIVTYYNQILGADNEAAPFDPNQLAPWQQYKKISDMELMVTTALQHTQSQESAIFEVSGTATVYGFLIPSPGDVFIATIDNGRQALFNVANVEKGTYMKGANYIINYKLLCYTDPGLLTNLSAKTVQAFTFVKSLLTQGQSPLLSTDQYALYGGLNTLFMDLASMYFRDFFSVERQTLLVPDQSLETTDHWIAKALLDLVGTDGDGALPKIRLPAVGGDQAMVNKTFWDALLHVNRTYLMTGIQRVGLVYTVIFRNWANLGGIYYTGIDQIVYPKDARTDVDALYDHVEQPSMKGYAQDGTLRYSDLERILRETELGFFEAACQCVEGTAGAPAALPDIVPVTIDDYYVFSAGFYGARGTPLASKLESLTASAINTGAINRSLLTHLATRAFNWPNLERFYYIPVLLALIQISLASNAS